MINIYIKQLTFIYYIYININYNKYIVSVSERLKIIHTQNNIKIAAAAAKPPLEPPGFQRCGSYYIYMI